MRVEIHDKANGYGVALIDRAWRVCVELRKNVWYLSNVSYHTKPAAQKAANNYASALGAEV